MTDWPKPGQESEPEIIPPDARMPPRSRIWVAQGDYGYRRVHVARLGPLGLVLLGAAIGAASLITVLLLLGALLIWLPVIGLVAAVAIISGILRGPYRGPH